MGMAAQPQPGFLDRARMRARPKGPAQSSVFHNYARSGPTKEAIDGLSINQTDSGDGGPTHIASGWMRRRSGLVVPGGPWRDGRRSVRPGPAGSPETRHHAWADTEDRGPWLRLHNGRRSILPARCGDAEAHERLAIVKRGQTLGFGALVLMLATIVTLAAIGQPWVAGIVATTGLAVIVAIFVTGEYQPAPVHSPEVAPPRPIRLPQQELPGMPPRGPEATNVRVI
jgi:hypothetical protein